MTTPTPADLNEQHREFWRKRNLRIDALMENHDIVDTATKREIKKAAYVLLATNEVDRNERIRHQINFDVELENIDEEFGSHFRAIAARRANVKKPRGKLVGGKSVAEIVIELLSSPQMSRLDERAAWDALPEAVARFGIGLNAVNDEKDPEQDKYAYSFRGGVKTLGRGHFRNLRTTSRKAVIQISA
jgi:hypothetical protein